MSQAHLNTYRSVHSDGPDPVGVGVATYLSPFLEVAHLQGPRAGVGHCGHQAAAEQPLCYVDVRIVWISENINVSVRKTRGGHTVFMDEIHWVSGVDAEETVAIVGTHSYTTKILSSSLASREIEGSKIE